MMLAVCICPRAYLRESGEWGEIEVKVGCHSPDRQRLSFLENILLVDLLVMGRDFACNILCSGI